MILEHALLRVKPGQGASFETAMRQARPLIAVSPGFLSIEVRPAVEQDDLYLLTVIWADIASHRDGFRNSDRYEHWRILLHDFYDPTPTVSYSAQDIFARLSAQDLSTESIP
ncbi:heme-degrading monooxygenase HmoA [Sphingomonas sp. UYAg733]